MRGGITRPVASRDSVSSCVSSFSPFGSLHGSGLLRSFWRTWCSSWWTFPTVARMSWRSWSTNLTGSARSSWGSRIFSNRSACLMIQTWWGPFSGFERHFLCRCHDRVPRCRSSSCCRPPSQTVGTVPCWDWRSWPTSATPPSGTSADCVTAFCVTPSRTTVKIRCGLRVQAPALRSVRECTAGVGGKRWKRWRWNLLITEADLRSTNS